MAGGAPPPGKRKHRVKKKQQQQAAAMPWLHREESIPFREGRTTTVRASRTTVAAVSSIIVCLLASCLYFVVLTSSASRRPPVPTSERRWWKASAPVSLLRESMLSSFNLYQSSSFVSGYPVSDQLLIKDPNFYNIFTVDEIIAFFPELPTQAVPFFLWDTHPGLKQFSLKCKKSKQNDYLINKALQNSPWRVRDTSLAAIHIIPFLQSSLLAGECETLSAETANEAATRLRMSDEWRAHSGSNFLIFASSWLHKEREKARLQDIYNNDRRIVYEDDKIFDLAHMTPISSPTADTALHPCSIIGSFPATLPRGIQFPTYKSPRGAWQQMLEERPYLFSFYGPADFRSEHHKARRRLFQHADRLALLPDKPNAFIREGVMVVDKKPKAYRRARAAAIERQVMKVANRFGSAFGYEYEPSHAANRMGCANTRLCQKESDYTRGCCDDASQVNRTDIMTKSIFGLHFPGEEFSSSGLADILAAGQIPIIVMTESLSLSLPHQCFVPWERIAFFVPLREWIDDPSRALRSHVTKYMRDHVYMEKKVRLLEYYRQAILFHTASDDGRLASHFQLLDFAAHCLWNTWNQDFTSRHHVFLNKALFKCPFGDATVRADFSFLRYDVDFPRNPWNNTNFFGALREKMAVNRNIKRTSYLQRFINKYTRNIKWTRPKISGK